MLFLPGFFSLPPTDRDEARFAQATRQMLESRDFVDIRFQDEARHKKPVGIYWMQSAAVTLAGGPEQAAIWAYRLPSLIGAVLAVLLTFWIGSTLFGPTAGFLGAVMLAGTVLLGVEARTAKTDAALFATILAAQGVLAHVWLRREAREALGLGLGPAVLGGARRRYPAEGADHPAGDRWDDPVAVGGDAGDRLAGAAPAKAGPAGHAGDRGALADPHHHQDPGRLLR